MFPYRLDVEDCEHFLAQHIDDFDGDGGSPMQCYFPHGLRLQPLPPSLADAPHAARCIGADQAFFAQGVAGRLCLLVFVE